MGLVGRQLPPDPTCSPTHPTNTRASLPCSQIWGTAEQGRGGRGFWATGTLQLPGMRARAPPQVRGVCEDHRVPSPPSPSTTTCRELHPSPPARCPAGASPPLPTGCRHLLLPRRTQVGPGGLLAGLWRSAGRGVRHATSSHRHGDARSRRETVGPQIHTTVIPVSKSRPSCDPMTSGRKPAWMLKAVLSRRWERGQLFSVSSSR